MAKVGDYYRRDAYASVFAAEDAEKILSQYKLTNKPLRTLRCTPRTTIELLLEGRRGNRVVIDKAYFVCDFNTEILC